MRAGLGSEACVCIVEGVVLAIGQDRDVRLPDLKFMNIVEVFPMGFESYPQR